MVYDKYHKAKDKYMVKHGSFYEKHQSELAMLGKYYKETLSDDIIPFWENRILDTEMGGYFNCFNRYGSLEKDVKCGWFIGRDIYTFSLLYHKFQQKQEWLNLAEEGVKFLLDKAYLQNGRFAFMMERSGKVITGASSILTDFLAVTGLYEYIIASGDMGYLDFAKEATDQLLNHIEDKDLLKAEGFEKGVENHSLNFLTISLCLESKKLFGETYQVVLEECVEKSLYKFANDDFKAIFELVREDGSVYLEGDGRFINLGHGMESMWYSMRAGMECNRMDWIQRASEVIDWLIERGYDETHNGFFQELSLDGSHKDVKRFTAYGDVKVPWDGKIWWTQTESMYALALSALLTQNEKHYDYFIKMHNYTETFFHDKEYGEWYSFLYRNGDVLCDKKGSTFKGPFHVPVCMLQIYLLIDEYLNIN